MRKFKTVALEINYCDRADTDHGIRSVCGQLLCNQVKEVRTLKKLKRALTIARQASGAQEISQLYYMRRKEISQMIKATSQSVCSGMTGCQVELLGSGAELIKEYKEVTAAMYRSLRGHMPEELAKEVLVSITKEAIKQAEEKR